MIKLVKRKKINIKHYYSYSLMIRVWTSSAHPMNSLTLFWKIGSCRYTLTHKFWSQSHSSYSIVNNAAHCTITYIFARTSSVWSYKFNFELTSGLFSVHNPCITMCFFRIKTHIWHVLVTLPVGVTTHLCSQQEQSFSVRTCI